MVGLFISFLLGFTPLRAQDSSGVRKLDEAYYGWRVPNGLCLSGEYVMVTDLFSGLHIIHIGDLLHPIQTGALRTTLDNVPNYLEVAGNYAYIGARQGLMVVDVSNPGKPEQIKGEDQPQFAGLAVACVVEPYLYGVDNSGYFTVIDISDPFRLRLAAVDSTIGGVKDIIVRGDYAYLATKQEGLVAMDISELPDLKVVGSLVFENDAKSLAGMENYLCVATSYTVEVVDITDPTELRPITTLPVRANSIAMAFNFLCISDMLEQLVVYDLTVPAQPNLISRIKDAGNMRRMLIKDWLVVGVSRTEGLLMFDYANRIAPRKIGEFFSPGVPRAVTLSEDYCYVADSHEGIRFYDLANPAVLKETGIITDVGVPIDLVTDGDYLYVAGDKNGVTIVDVNDPLKPKITGSYDTPGRAMGVAISDNYAYVADDSSGLRILNVKNKTNPLSAGILDTPGRATAVVVNNQFAYIADGTGGLRVVDISDPTKPAEAGVFPMEWAQAVAVQGNYAYVADQPWGLRIIDITDHANLLQVGFFPIVDALRSVTVVGQYAYVAAEETGVRVMDITDPQQPKEIGWYDTPGLCYDIAVGSDGLLYVADYYRVGIYSVSDIVSVGHNRVEMPKQLLFNSYPNPFNASISFSWQLPEAMPVCIAVYDLRGREVAQPFAEKWLNSGNHSLIWRANDLPAGNYVVRLTGPDRTVEQTVTLIK